MTYQGGSSKTIFNPTIALKSSKDLYGLLDFDLRHQEFELKNGSTKIELRYTLSGTLNADYSLHTLVLYEEEIYVDIPNGKGVLRA